MPNSQKTLEDLLVDEEKVNEELLHDLLSNYIQIGNQSGDLIPKSEFNNLNTKQKTCAVLLAQRARHELEMVETEWLSPKTISEQNGVKKGTIYRIVRELNEEGLVENDDGEYRIPVHNLHRAKNLIYGSESDE